MILLESLAPLVLPMNITLLFEGGCVTVLPFVQGIGKPKGDGMVSCSH